jgi:hypothetical protein
MTSTVQPTMILLFIILYYILLLSLLFYRLECILKDPSSSHTTNLILQCLFADPTSNNSKSCVLLFHCVVRTRKKGPNKSPPLSFIKRPLIHQETHYNDKPYTRSFTVSVLFFIFFRLCSS